VAVEKPVTTMSRQRVCSYNEIDDFVDDLQGFVPIRKSNQDGIDAKREARSFVKALHLMLPPMLRKTCHQLMWSTLVAGSSVVIGFDSLPQTLKGRFEHVVAYSKLQAIVF
jgi:hypothetical protein